MFKCQTKYSLIYIVIIMLIILIYYINLLTLSNTYGGLKVSI